MRKFLAKHIRYNDYYFKSVLRKRANGILKFIGLPYTIQIVYVSEYMGIGPSVSRVDFAGDAKKDKKTITLILECQSTVPTEEDFKRFFQYVSSLRLFKNYDVELYILCTQEVPFDKNDFVINDDCTYTMHIISLKDFKAEEIFKNIENKLKNNEVITDEDIAALQLIVYTDHEESDLDILIKARRLLNIVAEKSHMDINEKLAIIYLFEVLSANMLSADDNKKYVEENKMILNPVERYIKEEGKQEGLQEGLQEGMQKGQLQIAKSLVDSGFPIDEIVLVSGLSKEDILNFK